jgi:hypothetical protein
MKKRLLSLQGFSVYVASISEDQDIIAKAPKNLMPGCKKEIAPSEIEPGIQYGNLTF